MKILQVIQSLGLGGAERVCFDLSAELLERGHRVKIVLLNDLVGIDFSPYHQEFDIHPLLPGESPIYTRALHRLAPAFARVYREGWDVVHCHMDGALLVAALGGGHRICYTLHSSFHPRWQGITLQRLRAIIEWVITRRADIQLVGCGPGPTAWARVHLRSPRKDILEVVNGIDLRRFPFRAGPWKPQSPLRILMVGSLKPEKDYETAVRAIKCLVQAGLKVELKLAGDGQLREHLQNLAKQLDIADSVVFLGPRHDVSQLHQESDLFWLTSTYEGLPIALLEAMASGLPIIATDAPGIREIARPAAIPLVPISTPEALAQATLELLGGPAKTEEIRHLARSQVESLFSAAVMTNNYLSIYDELLDNKANQSTQLSE